MIIENYLLSNLFYSERSISKYVTLKRCWNRPQCPIAEGGPVGFPTGGTDGTGSASFPKPWGFQGGMPLWSQDTARCPRRGGSEALEGGTRSGSPSKGQGLGGDSDTDRKSHEQKCLLMQTEGRPQPYIRLK
jgi:hypothetical protein